MIRGKTILLAVRPQSVINYNNSESKMEQLQKIIVNNNDQGGVGVGLQFLNSVSE